MKHHNPNNPHRKTVRDPGQPGRPSVEEMQAYYERNMSITEQDRERWRFRPQEPKYEPAKKPVESDDEWWPDAGAAATALGRVRSAIREAIRNRGECAGRRIKWSRYRTRQRWEAARRHKAERVA